MKAIRQTQQIAGNHYFTPLRTLRLCGEFLFSDTILKGIL